MKKTALAALLALSAAAASAAQPDGRWQILEAAGKPADGAFIEFDAAEHRLHASAGCNTLNAAYRVTKGRLKAQAAASTLKACEGDAMEHEAAIAQILEHGAAYRVKGNTLTLTGRRGKVLLRAERESE